MPVVEHESHAELPTPAASPPKLTVSELAQATGQWLRMFAQAGVTVIPRDDWPTEFSPPGSSGTGALGSVAGLVWQRGNVLSGGLSAWIVDCQAEAGPATLAAEAEPPNALSAAPLAAPSGSGRPEPRAVGLGAGTVGSEPSQPLLPGAKAAAGFGPDLAQLPDLPNEQRVVQLQVLEDAVRVCQRCPELVKNRTQTVFGTGNLRPRLVLMGEAPGVDEDRLGQPMVGPSGQLLNKIIAAMKMNREDVYLLNAAKCRPPQNRNPSDNECANCRPYWERQLEILRPEVIVCLGSVASKTLLQTSSYVGQLRGTIHEYRGAKVVVTYHPSYLLRTESAKRQTWDDMKTVMQLLNLPL